MSTNNAIAIPSSVPLELILTSGKDAVQKWQSWWSSMPKDSDEEEVLKHYVGAMRGESIWDYDGEPFEVSHLLGVEGWYPDLETGKDRLVTRVHMVGPKGKIYYTSSKFAIQDLMRIQIEHGQPPWNPPLLVEPVKATGRRGVEFQGLRVVDPNAKKKEEKEEPAEKPTKKGK